MDYADVTFRKPSLHRERTFSFPLCSDFLFFVTWSANQTRVTRTISQKPLFYFSSLLTNKHVWSDFYHIFKFDAYFNHGKLNLILSAIRFCSISLFYIFTFIPFVIFANTPFIFVIPVCLFFRAKFLHARPLAFGALVMRHHGNSKRRTTYRLPEMSSS